MKFLLVKSFSGFGDRIEHLLCVFNYCRHVGRTIVVDWTDHVWCGTEIEKEFSYYFILKNVEFMHIKDFKKLFIKSKQDGKPMKILPPFYSDIILRRSDENDVKYRYGDIQEAIKSIMLGKMKDFDCDVMVTTDLDKRNNNGVISISNLIYRPFIMDYIKKDPNYHFLMNNKFITVHLRGSDRSKYTEDHRPDLTNFSHHKEKYVKDIIKKIPHETQNILLLSDSTILVEYFLEIIDKKYNIIQTNNEKTSSDVGLHLERIPSKENKNLELLKDFYFMTNSTDVICDGVSRFSLTAKKICDVKKL